MILLFVLLSIISVILFILLIVSFRGNIYASRQLQSYDDFYSSTLEDVQGVIEFLNELSKREIIALDPDVIKLKNAVVITRDILVGYVNAGQTKKNIAEKERKEK